MSCFALATECVIRGMLRQRAAEIGFRSEVGGRGKSIQREVASFGAFQRIVPLVVDESETGAVHTGRKRENRNFTGRKPLGEVAGFLPAEIPAIGNRIGSGSGPWLDAGVPELLPQVDLAFQPLRSERRHIQTVVVENRVDQLELVVVQQLGNGVTDQPTLLQAPDVRLEGQGLVAPGYV